MGFPPLVLSTTFANLLALWGTLVKEFLQIAGSSRPEKNFLFVSEGSTHAFENQGALQKFQLMYHNYRNTCFGYDNVFIAIVYSLSWVHQN